MKFRFLRMREDSPGSQAGILNFKCPQTSMLNKQKLAQLAFPTENNEDYKQ